jgi:nitrogen fixation protein NifU and related proteins
MPDSATPGLDELYRDILLDHYRSPRNQGRLDGSATNRADGSNPLCGDELTVELAVEDGRITGVAFEGRGCSISQASASMMTLYVRDRPTADALAAVETFQQMMLQGVIPPEEFGDIEALAGVRNFPVRVKCASLAWKTLEQALSGDGSLVSTDERTSG